MRPILLSWALAVSAASAAAQPFPAIVAPAENPFTPQKAMLGKALFWDEQLSVSGTIACGTCHRPEVGGLDPRAPDARHPGFDSVFDTDDDVHGSPGVIATDSSGHYVPSEEFGLGVQVTRRLAPSVINAAVFTHQLWDGAVEDRLVDPLTGDVVIETGASLEAQALGPPVNPVEMGREGITWSDVVSRLAPMRPLAIASDLPGYLAQWLGNRMYEQVFEDVFGSPGVTPVRVAMAIATYERTLISDQSPFDRWLAGEDAMSPLEVFGHTVFFESNCFTCHGLNDFHEVFANSGVRPSFEDPGVGGVTGVASDLGSFKAPFLRNLGSRPAFFHNGGAATLAEVVDFYDRGGDFAPPGGFFQPLGLSDSKKLALVVFLRDALTDSRVSQRVPPFDRPTLFTERAEASEPFGHGTQGTFGIVPRLIAVEPPVLGNLDYTLGIRDGAGGMPGALLIDLAPGDGSVSVHGAPLFVAGSAALRVVSLGSLGGDLWGEGYGSWSMPIPAASSLAGLSLYAQGLVADFGSPGGVASTGGARIELFAPREP